MKSKFCACALVTAALAFAACGRPDLLRPGTGRDDGNPATSGRSAYDSNSSVKHLGSDSAVGGGGPVRVTPPGSQAAPEGMLDTKVGPNSYPSPLPSGTSGQALGWGGSGFGSHPATRVSSAEPGMDGVHFEP